ncbi:MAG: hydroxymethylglutaryl-CoA lyase [Deltaproteobacteria bacterium]|nr:hydroxymethylglutaryl-CoA lyase [Deltaproteobacteria bacterium]
MAGLFSSAPKRVKVVEVGARDGLQNEPDNVPTHQKVALVDALSEAAIPQVEVTSFVSPKWIPQLADAVEVASKITRRAGTIYSALVPNMEGYERFREAGLDQAALFVSASETHNKKNVNKTIAETLEAFRPVAEAAKSDGVPLRAYVSTVLGCPYEGAVTPQKVRDTALALLDLGVAELSLGDTIGAGNPASLERLLDAVLRDVPVEKIALHLHDTRGTALANVVVGLEMGVTTFDAAIGGLGGCPYAPGASGNLPTEDLVQLLHGMGVETDIDYEKLIEAARLARRLVGRPLPSHMLAASEGPRGVPPIHG